MAPPRLCLLAVVLVGRCSAVAPLPARAMWQLWLPRDMENFVAEAEPTAESVLAAMDKCAETSWMMNMGAAKGDLIEQVIRQRKPKRLLEVGTFLGYMSIRIARSMPADAKLTTLEIDPDNYAASKRIRSKALGARDRSVVALKANATEAIPSLKGPFDFVLMDHWKPDYAADLEALRKRGLLADGCLVVADNVLFPGAPELLDYLNVPYVPAADAVSGQACLAAAGDRPAEAAARVAVHKVLDCEAAGEARGAVDDDVVLRRCRLRGGGHDQRSGAPKEAHFSAAREQTLSPNAALSFSAAWLAQRS